MDKQKSIIFGTAGTGKKIYKKIRDKEDVIAFSDNDASKWGQYTEEKIKIISPPDIITHEFDKLYIGSMVGLDEISSQLLSLGVPAIKIIKDLPFVQVQSRIFFLENIAKLVYARNMRGSVAEAGVYKGDYSKEINRVFPDRKLYLFDTFEGFPERDIEAEDKKSDVSAEYLKQTSEDVVIKRMPHRENCIVKKGYFPETVGGIEDDFVYVSLDMDLYQPTLAGIEYFYPRMVDGGIIAIHDYFSDAYPNVRQSLKDYENEHHITLKTCPVGDDVSIAIIK